MRLVIALAAALSALSAVPAVAERIAPPEYPESRAEPVSETIFGEAISDPYRWLEADIRQSEDVAEWVEAQNAVTRSYLEQIPQRAWFRERLGGLMDYERFGIPRRAGERYFYTRNVGLQNQPQLFVRDGLSRPSRLLLDPNQWSEDGTIALSTWEPSPDGSLLAFSQQVAGSDWRTIRVIDVASGMLLDSAVRWVKFSRIAWVGNHGFFYSRFPEPDEDAGYLAPNFDHAVYFHRVGTSQSRDSLVFASPKVPERRHEARVTSDGRWAIITSQTGTDARHSVRLIKLRNAKRSGFRQWQSRPMITSQEHEWEFLASVNGWLYFLTDYNATRGQILAFDPSRRRSKWRQVLGEGEQTISGASIVGNHLLVETIVEAATKAELYDLAGRPLTGFALAQHGTASGFGGKPGDPETFYSFASFNRPDTVYRLDLATGETEPFAEPDLTFVPDDYLVEQRFFTSKDGTRVPIFIVRSRELAESGKPAPTLLYGYGGFDVSLTPGFSSKRMAWLEAGGVFALANVRGGGELGKAWHEAGRGPNKQNSFDDFIAAGEFLKAEGYTTADGLAIEGRSNGGLMVAAVVNQRPDLFDAAHAAVGVMDMLRFDRWTAGRFWVDDYGSPSKEADFRLLRSYSPYHNVAQQTDYPAVLITTADTDDRVVPAHSFKYAARLQNDSTGVNPKLIRVENGAGHGRGKPTEMRVEESADVLSFLAYHTGLSIDSGNIHKKR
ncbi:prolyl oligopeptidase family serine peptidase [Altererythrobacter lutimaris]|uniref:prolyl oligopeptidase n=1 Tax=Altererythrobacter lutimaris TaxID=2743979 RepID=A0A850H9F8_9SPHN|nr:prolyl oligopeptidase family serine peptidase [Altererythrobacter lutimaris]NVE94130.1 S9 family peptidase [Altererythrobacter lutimaris]